MLSRVLPLLVVVACQPASPPTRAPDDPAPEALASPEAEAPSDPPPPAQAETEPVEPEPAEAEDALVMAESVEPTERPPEPPPPPRPPELSPPEGPVKASRIRPGTYRCKISKEYRFRPCTVEIDDYGRSILTIPTALINVRGVLTDKGKATRFDGFQTELRPFGCYSCQERCSIEPNSCVCQEIPPAASAECLQQPIRFTLNKQGDQWRGWVEYHLYSGDTDPEDPSKHLFRSEKYVVVMRR